MLATSTRHASQGRMLASRVHCCLPRSTVLRSGLLAAVVPSTSSSRQVAAMAADQKAILVPIGTGTEEMEAVITIDVLRRAGAAVTVASVENSLEVTCEHYRPECRASSADFMHTAVMYCISRHSLHTHHANMEHSTEPRCTKLALRSHIEMCSRRTAYHGAAHVATCSTSHSTASASSGYAPLCSSCSLSHIGIPAMSAYSVHVACPRNVSHVTTFGCFLQTQVHVG
jgi:hypothetical protein